MAAIAVTVAGKIYPGSVITVQHTAPAGEALLAGDLVRFDPTTGYFWKANAAAAIDFAGLFGLALESVGAGFAVTAIQKGWVDGLNLTALGYGAPVFLGNTDGIADTVAGTTKIVIGQVMPAFAGGPGTSPDKVLLLDVGAGLAAAL